MFTGIVERTGKVCSVTSSGGTARIVIEAENFFDDLSLGDSVAIDGVCLTIVEMTAKSAAFDVSKETITCSIMGGYKAGSAVNMEKALRLSDRLGGHLVQGHVDGIGKFTGQKEMGEYIDMTFEVPDTISRYIVGKGSITINGISLTAARLEGNRITIAVIPHTLRITSLAGLKPGGEVNLEADLIAKYVEKLLLSNEGDGVTRELLEKKGFI